MTKTMYKVTMHNPYPREWWYDLQDAKRKGFAIKVERKNLNIRFKEGYDKARKHDCYGFEFAWGFTWGHTENPGADDENFVPHGCVATIDPTKKYRYRKTAKAL